MNMHTEARPDISPQSLAEIFLARHSAPLTEAEQHFLQTGTRADLPYQDGTIASWTWGTGPCVLLVHGWGGRAADFAQMVPMLVAGGFSPTLFDAPAHGLSSGLKSSVPHHARSVLFVAAKTGPLAGVIGHSVGSAAVLWALKNGLHVPKSIHIAGLTALPNVLKGFAKAHGLPRDRFAEFLGYVEAYAGAPVADFDAKALARGLNHDGLVIHDREDRKIPVGESEQLHALWPRSTLELSAGLGHMRILSDRQIILRCVNFLLNDDHQQTGVPV